ncbi:hypothetical protein [Pseudomonas akapageensis]|uniref:hypothetical protein n=1 Tax=Pseudomonas akapageensis TaxID=2609961 RepID=UPI00140BD272|nr:hypothetical protein [Pseudomonas akapageensis]
MKFSYPASFLILCLFYPGISSASLEAVDAGVPPRLQLADSKSAAKPAAKPKQPAKAVASKTKARKSAEVISTRLPPAHLDLSLPQQMVDELEPPAQVVGVPRNGVLPSMFADKPAGDSPYQLNGRLISNEMQLQLRNDSRHEVEGAAIEFEYKH